MARSDDDLDDEERELLRAHRESKQSNDESDEVEIGLGEGRYFRGSYSRAKRLGYVTEPEPAADPKGGKGEGGQVKRFTGGRRTG